MIPFPPAYTEDHMSESDDLKILITALKKIARAQSTTFYYDYKQPVESRKRVTSLSKDQLRFTAAQALLKIGEVDW